MSKSLSDAINEIFSQNEDISYDTSGVLFTKLAENNIQRDISGKDIHYQHKSVLGKKGHAAWDKLRQYDTEDLTTGQRDQLRILRDKLKRAKINAHVENDGDILKEKHPYNGVYSVISVEQEDMQPKEGFKAAEEFLAELSEEFGSENITYDVIIENLLELNTLVDSLNGYFDIDNPLKVDNILDVDEIASENDPYKQHEMAYAKLKQIIHNDKRNGPTPPNGEIND